MFYWIVECVDRIVSEVGVSVFYSIYCLLLFDLVLIICLRLELF